MSAPAHHAPPATKLLALPGDYGQTDFVMRRGGRLARVEVGYESWGTLSREGDNAILIFTGLSPTAHAASCPEDESPGWWEYMIGPGKPIDTDRFFVVCVNNLGGCFGSTGPLSINPATGEPYRLTFPELAIEDIAKAGHHALAELGVEQLHTVIGPSMGGLTALAYVLQYPDEVRNLLAISTASRVSPFGIAVHAVQREIVCCDPYWKEGAYDDEQRPDCGMRLARKLGFLSYRGLDEWPQRFNRARVAPERAGEGPFGMEFEVESYLEHQAKKFVQNFDANCYLYMLEAMDTFDVADHGGTVSAGLAKIQTEHALIIGVESDLLFPICQQEELAEGLRRVGRNVEFARLDSSQGHDSFLTDREQFAPVIRDFLAKL